MAHGMHVTGSWWSQRTAPNAQKERQRTHCGGSGTSDSPTARDMGPPPPGVSSTVLDMPPAFADPAPAPVRTRPALLLLLLLLLGPCGG